MTKTIRLNDLQLVLLAAAAGRGNGSLVPLPETCGEDTTRVGKAIASLVKRALVAELPVNDRKLAWREDAEAMIGLFITDAGRSSIGAGDEEPQFSEVEDVVQPAAPATSKITAVLDLLSRTDGATLDEMVAATGWLPHTTRAALTGLRKKGHAIARDKRGEATCYHIAAEA